MIRYTPAVGKTVEDILDIGRKSDLNKLGDMKLVWVNEGDLAIGVMNGTVQKYPECRLSCDCPECSAM